MAVGINTGVKYTFIGGPREPGRTNLVVNPKAQNNTTGMSTSFSAGLTATAMTRVVCSWYAGADYAYRLQATQPADTTARFAQLLTASGTSGAPVSSSTVYAVSARVKSNDASASGIYGARVGITWYNAAGTALTTANGPDAFGAVNGVITHTAVSPATAAFARFEFTVLTNVANDVLNYEVTELMLQQSSVPTSYFDGDRPGYSWSGTVHGSSSAQDGTRAVLNDSTDPDYVGMAAEVTGIDGVEIRESFIENVEDDGGSHGDFYAGRRPVTVTAEIGGNATVTQRNQMQQRWLNATGRALRGPLPGSPGFTSFPLNTSTRPGVMIWQPTGFSEMYLRYRTQQATRISGNWLKSGGAALIADDPRIYGTIYKTTGTVVMSGGVVSSAATTWDRGNNFNSVIIPSGNNGRGDFTVTNNGDTAVGGIITLTGPASIPIVIQNVTTGEELAWNTTNLLAGQTLTIDLLAKTAMLSATSIFGGMVVPRSRWFKFAPGANTIRLIIGSANTGATTFRIDYRDGWM